MRSIPFLAVATISIAGLIAGAASGQRTDVFVASRDHPAIHWTKGPVNDVVADLNRRLAAGSAQLAFDTRSGYLRATLDALSVPVESQVLVFSETSAQATLINPKNPRALYFNDSVAVGWVRGAKALELAVQDRQQGVSFYTLEQMSGKKPHFERDTSCVLCHATWDTLGVPGLIVISTFQMSDDPNAYASGVVEDHRTPIDQRWGGWYVTSKGKAVQHLGNVPVIVPAAKLKPKPGSAPQLSSVEGQFETSGFPTHYSDIVALMVLAHQTHMTNLLTRVGWEARVAASDAQAAAPRFAGPATGADTVPPRVREAVRDLVDYLFFVDEAPLPGGITGTSGFAEKFAAEGPYDARGRSLRQFDLVKRLMKYPCSYMVYTAAFDGLPDVAKGEVYRRMWEILSGKDKKPSYARLSTADRQAIVEILRDTKKDLPSYFRLPGN
jgi:hypothetical protein